MIQCHLLATYREFQFWGSSCHSGPLVCAGDWNLFSCTERKKQIEIQFQLVFMNYTHWVELKYSLPYKKKIKLENILFLFPWPYLRTCSMFGRILNLICVGCQVYIVEGDSSEFSRNSCTYTKFNAIKQLLSKNQQEKLFKR